MVIQITLICQYDKFSTFLWAWLKLLSGLKSERTVTVRKNHLRIDVLSQQKCRCYWSGLYFSLTAVMACWKSKPHSWPLTSECPTFVTRLALYRADWPHKRAEEPLSSPSTSGASHPHHLLLCLITVCVKGPPASPRLFPNQRQSIKFSCASFLVISHLSSLPISLHLNLRLNLAVPGP